MSSTSETSTDSGRRNPPGRAEVGPEDSLYLHGALWIYGEGGALEEGVYLFGGPLEAGIRDVEQIIQMELEVDLEFHPSFASQEVFAKLFERSQTSVAVIAGCNGYVVSWAYLPEDFDPDLRWT